MHSTSTTSAEPGVGSRIGNALLWVVQVVTASWFLLAALGKFTGAEPMRSIFDAIGYGDWFRYLVGALEAAGALALVVPPLCGIAAAGLSLLMVGAVVVQQTAMSGGVALPLVLLACTLVIAVGRRRSIVGFWVAVGAFKRARH